MARILVFPKSRESEQNKTIILPHVFIKLLELYKQHQDEIRNRKIEFLRQQAFQYYYDELGEPEIKTSGVDLPEFILRKQAEQKRCEIANQNAAQIMLQVIADNRVDECYRKRVKELKKLSKIGR